MNLDFTKPLPAPTPIDGLLDEYLGTRPRYVEESGSRWHLFFGNLFSAADDAADADTPTIAVKRLS